MQDMLEVIKELVDNCGISFLGSVDSGGFPNIKAMLLPRRREGLKTIWYSANASSLRVGHYRSNPHACVYYCDPIVFKGVLITGTVEILEDSEIKKEFWEDEDIVYYPKGVTDPDYCILKFTALNARYYSDFKSHNIDVSALPNS